MFFDSSTISWNNQSIFPEGALPSSVHLIFKVNHLGLEHIAQRKPALA